MDKKIKEAIEKYQCVGCMSGSSVECYEKGFSLGCQRHFPGTRILGDGKIFTGLPIGFTHLGPYDDQYILIFESYETAGFDYDFLNIPVWKYVKDGHTFVRGLSPRINTPLIHIFLEDCSDKIDCHQLTEDNLAHILKLN